jgi:uncharacterized protein with beta-barrel porin domain
MPKSIGPWRRVRFLLSSSSLAALIIGGSGHSASASLCDSATAGGYDNPSLSSIICINANTLSITGNITNEGSLTRGANQPAILLSGTTVTGFIGNSGTAQGYLELTNSSSVTGGFTNSGTFGGVLVNFGSSLSGGIFNSSSGVLSENGPAIDIRGTLSGGITNAGLILSENGPAIDVSNTSNITIFNSGRITGGGGTAIQFGGGTNTLTLGPGYSITGFVFGSGNDILQLGGSGNGSFDLSAIGNSTQQYQGFTTFNVISGTWTVNNTYGQNNPWTVQGGSLLVNGDLSAASNLTVTGGLLGGTGIVGNTQINSGGTFAPGTPGSPGTSMTVAGNLAFQSGAIYLVQVSPTASTMANVTGTASLAGNVLAAFAPGSYVNKQYDILHSAGLGGTTFASLGTTNLPAGFSASLSYTPTDVFLNLRAGLVPTGGVGGNQANVANSLNNFFNGGGSLPPNFLTIFGLTGGNLSAALSQLSGEAATGGEQTSFQLMNQFLGLLVDPFANGRGGSLGGGGAIGFAPEQASNLPPEIAMAYASVLKAPPYKAAAPVDQRWSVWGQAYGGYNTADGNQALGSNNLTARAYGLASGFDYRLTPDTVVGFALAGGGTNWSLAQALGTGRSDAVQAGVYGTTRSGPAYVSASLALANYWMTTSRVAVGDTLTANFNAQSYGGRLEGGYRFGVAAIGVTPYAAVQTQWFVTPNYRETDLSGGGFGLAYNSMTANDTRSELGARFDNLQAFNGMPLMLRARVAYAHDWVSNPSLTATFQALPGATFLVNGAAVPKDTALASASAALQLTRNWSLEAKFDGQFAGNWQTYTGSGTVRYSW